MLEQIGHREPRLSRTVSAPVVLSDVRPGDMVDLAYSVRGLTLLARPLCGIDHRSHRMRPRVASTSRFAETRPATKFAMGGSRKSSSADESTEARSTY